MSVKQTSINVSETNPLNPDLGGVGVSSIAEGVVYSPGSGSDFTSTHLDLDKFLVGGASSPVQASLVAGSGLTITRNANDFTFAASGASGFTQVVLRTFLTAGGPSTYTPTSGMKCCIVEIVGGGGGGGGGESGGVGTGAIGAGGGSGGYCKRTYSAAEIGASQTYTIGSGGVGGNSIASAGTATTFGAGATLMTANGGNPGDRMQPLNWTVAGGIAGPMGGAGGTASGGQINLTGEAGKSSFICVAAANAASVCIPEGGDSKFAVGGRFVTLFFNTRIAPGNGGGGVGGVNYNSGAAAAGQSGGSGGMIITEYI